MVKQKFESSISLRHWERPSQAIQKESHNAVIDCGWGRLLFAQTFQESADLVEAMRQEQAEKRDIAIYVRNPQVVTSLAPQELFLDPSITYRLWLDREMVREEFIGIEVRPVADLDEARALQQCYLKHHMIPASPEFVVQRIDDPCIQHLVAIDLASGQVVGGVTGVDHVEAFQDPENGSSLWALVVDTQCPVPGVGEALVRALADRYRERGRTFMDLSVMYDNPQAITLYEKLGFERVPVFSLKSKNAYNENLFIAEAPEAALNPYAGIIVREARRRGILVEVLDGEGGFFALSHGGRTVVCRESLSELTTAVAMSRCDDKRVTHRLLASHGLRVPAQCLVNTDAQATAFLEEYDRLVVKPKRGEQGAGISVDVRDEKSLFQAIEEAKRVCDDVLLEEFIQGDDLRIIVIDHQVVAAAVRRPPQIQGTGNHSVQELIAKQSRRRGAATGGESHIPIDAETERCVSDAGYSLDAILPYAETLTVRKTANLHTGGTIHDVTERLSPDLRQVAIEASQALDIPVVGFDFIVPSAESDEYRIIEANERPGLANHEPQPTAERFIDLLFPQTRTY